MLCAEWALVNRDGRTTTVLPLLCKRWSCEVCQPVRSRWLKHDVRDGHPNRFLTITWRVRDGWSPDEAAQALRDAWRKYRALYIEEHGKGSLPFLAVFELTEKGWPHLHIVTRSGWIDHGELKAFMLNEIDSPVVSVMKIKSLAKAANYVAKYASKAPAIFKGCKRYWRSCDYVVADDDTGERPRRSRGTWQVVQTNWWTLVKEYCDLGYRCDLTLSHAILERPPP